MCGMLGPNLCVHKQLGLPPTIISIINLFRINFHCV